MCRWLAYAGPPIYLDTVLTRPVHSLIDQSMHARQNFVPGAAVTSMFRHDALPTNGDGFGIGWYGAADEPGLFHDVRPAWADANLHRIAEQVRSPLFLAHVRATLGGTISRANCHPFEHDGWLFQFNGEINGFDRVRRDLACDVAPELYPHIAGDTDTELCFHLALTYGLRDDVVGGLARMVGRVERARREHGVAEPFRATIAVTDGTTVWGLRYSSDRRSKTLFHTAGTVALRDVDGSVTELPDDARLLVSEPLVLGYRPQTWVEVPEWGLVTVRAGTDTDVSAFDPAA